MTKKTGITWYGADQLRANMDAYERKVLFAVKQVANYFAPIMETAAKEGAPWVDRTANARQSLHTYVQDMSRDIVRLYLSHGVDYGIMLEVGFAGKYSIIMPTIEQHIPEIRRMLQGIFR